MKYMDSGMYDITTNFIITPQTWSASSVLPAYHQKFEELDFKFSRTIRLIESFFTLKK